MQETAPLSDPLPVDIRFYLRTSYQNGNGEHPLIMKLMLWDQRKDLNTGIYASPKHWVARMGQFNPVNSECLRLNKELTELRVRTEQLVAQMSRDLGDFSLQEFTDRLQGRNGGAPETLMAYVHRKMENLSKRVKVDLAVTTYYKYRRMARYLQEFLSENYNEQDIYVSRIDKQFLEDLMLFLRSKKKNSQNSSSSLMNCLKTILDEPVQKAVIRRNPFLEISLNRTAAPRGYLSMEEIQQLMELEGLPSNLEKIRDMFLFACFTGLAYADMVNLKGEHIQKGKGGQLFISIPRQKTSVVSYIPLIDASVKLLQKYSPEGDIQQFKWKVPCNQIINRYLKELGQKAGIRKNLFMHLARHTFATTVTLSQGISIEAVSKMLGHTSLKHTQLYAKVVNEKIDNEMMKVKDLF